MKFRVEGEIESDQFDALTKQVADLTLRVDALEGIKPPPPEWEALFHFRKGDLTSDHARQMGSAADNKKIQFSGGAFSVSKSRPTIAGGGELLCHRESSHATKQVQIRIIHDSFHKDGQHWYLPFSGEYRIVLKYDYVGFPDSGPGRAKHGEPSVGGSGSDWSQLIEGWGPREGQSAESETPTWQIFAIGNVLRGVIESGDRFSREIVVNQNEVPFDTAQRELTIDYKPHPIDGYIVCAEVGLNWEGCTVLTHDKDGKQITHGPCLNVGYYGGPGRGFAYDEIKVVRRNQIPWTEDLYAA